MFCTVLGLSVIAFVSELLKSCLLKTALLWKEGNSKHSKWVESQTRESIWSQIWRKIGWILRMKLHEFEMISVALLQAPIDWSKWQSDEHLRNHLRYREITPGSRHISNWLLNNFPISQDLLNPPHQLYTQCVQHLFALFYSRSKAIGKL